MAQEERVKRRHNMSNRIRTKARTYSLSGLMWCKHCGSKVHIHQNSMGSLGYIVAVGPEVLIAEVGALS